MAGGFQWRNVLSRALRSEPKALRAAIPSQRATFSSRPHSTCSKNHVQAPRRKFLRGRPQWGLQSTTMQPFAPHRRKFSSTPTTQHGHLDPPKPGEERKVTFITKDNETLTFAVADGDNLLDIAQAHDIEMEGACGGSCACSTCHVIVEDPALYEKMEEPDDDENDMLDIAFGLTETSRLGCQVKMSKELDGLVVRLPSMTRNMQASDFESK